MKAIQDRVLLIEISSVLMQMIDNRQVLDEMPADQLRNYCLKMADCIVKLVNK